MDEVPLFLRIKFNRLRFAFLITGPLLLLSSLSLSPFFLRVLFRIVIHENRASTSQGYILSTWSVLSWLDPSLTFSAFFFFLPLLFLSYHCPPPSSINLFFSLRSSGPRNEQRKSIGWHCGFVPSPVVLRFSLILASAPVVPLMPRSPSRENSISFFFLPHTFSFLQEKETVRPDRRSNAVIFLSLFLLYSEGFYRDFCVLPISRKLASWIRAEKPLLFLLLRQRRIGISRY